MSKNASLVVVGTGIKLLSHLTRESETYIKESQKVLYLVNEPLLKEWVEKTNPNSESLDNLYQKYPLRLHCYRAITEYIVETVRSGEHVCVVFDGHPTVFAQSALHAVIQARKEGFDARVLPGISAEDCLFADLLINPGTYGCQSYEATDFLVREQKCDLFSHLILWQVGFIGVLDRPDDHDNTQGIQILIKHLRQYYALDHKVIVYEAALYPHYKPRIEEYELSKLSQAKLTRISTLYIPPVSKAKCSETMLESLGIMVENLT